MASYQLAPVLFLAPGAEPQVNAQRAAADASTGQGNIASGLFLENKSGTAARADAGTIETTVLGYCTNVLDAQLKPLPKGSYLSSNEAGFVDYIPDAQLLANNDLFIMGRMARPPRFRLSSTPVTPSPPVSTSASSTPPPIR